MIYTCECVTAYNPVRKRVKQVDVSVLIKKLLDVLGWDHELCLMNFVDMLSIDATVRRYLDGILKEQVQISIIVTTIRIVAAEGFE